MKSQGTVKIGGRLSSATGTHRNEASMIQVMLGLWHKVIKEGGAILVQVELLEVRGNECETIRLVLNIPRCSVQIDTPHLISSYASIV